MKSKAFCIWVCLVAGFVISPFVARSQVFTGSVAHIVNGGFEDPNIGAIGSVTMDGTTGYAPDNWTYVSGDGAHIHKNSPAANDTPFGNVCIGTEHREDLTIKQTIFLPSL